MVELSLTDSEFMCYSYPFLRLFLQILPNDAWIHAEGRPGDGTEATVNTGDKIFCSDHVGVLQNPLSYPFGMFNDVRGAVDHAWYELQPIGNSDIAPNFPLMRVSAIGCHEGNRPNFGLDQNWGQLLQGHIMIVRTLPGAPADMHTLQVSRTALGGIVQGLDMKFGKLEELLIGEVR